jgi:hypothetical protein
VQLGTTLTAAEVVVLVTVELTSHVDSGTSTAQIEDRLLSTAQVGITLTAAEVVVFAELVWTLTA